MSQVAIVTGGASGIGLALGRALAAAGARVTLADRDEASLDRALAELRRAGRDVDGRVLDVTDREAVRRAYDEVAERRGSLDLVFNNAGIGMGGEMQDLSPEDWRRMLDVNLMGVLHGIDAAYPRMIAQGHGHIVNTASVAGLVPMPGELPYVACKYAVVGVTHALRAEAADLGVHVTVVCPGVVDTPIYQTSPIIGYDKERVLRLLPRGISAERCAAQILRGVRRNRATIVITPAARLLWLLHRASPSLFLAGARLYMRRLRALRE